MTWARFGVGCQGFFWCKSMTHHIALCRVDELNVEPCTAVLMASRTYAFESARV
jgi:hypothetical protein